MVSTKSSRLSASFAAVQGSYWLSCSALFGFSVVLLQSKNLSNTQVGLILALQSIASIIGQPLIAGFADKRKHIPLKHIISAALMFGIGSAVLLIFAPPSILLLTAIFILLGMTVNSAASLINALAVQFINIGVPINFGIARGVGSICYALGGFALGKLVSAYGTTVILPAHALLMVLTIVFVLLFKKPNTETLSLEAVKRKPQSQKPLLKMLWENKPLLGVLLASTFAFFSQNLLTNYSINILKNVGGSSKDLGTSILLMSSSELPVMFLFAFLAKRFKAERMLVFAFFFFFVRAVAISLAPSVTLFLAAQPLQMLSFGLYIPASVFFVNEIVSDAEKVRGQAMIGVASSGIGSTLACLVGGVFLDTFGVHALLLGSCISGALAFVTMLITIRTYNQRNQPMQLAVDLLSK